MIAGYTAVLPTDMATAEERVREALQAEGFGVLTEIDVAATLKAKLDLDREPLKILGACNPVLASQVLARDVSMALMLPCNVVLEGVPEGVRVRAIDPIGMLPGDEMADLAAEAGERLSRAVASLEG